ncbi:hypothetical protein IAT38_007805 [Cryptococcus sp. DSM 104549]
MTYLTTHLPFASTSALPAPGTHLVISDTLPSPGMFVLYHLISVAIGKEKRKVVWVDFRGEGRVSLEAVLKKLGTPLPPASSTSFIHISPSPLPHIIPIPPKTPRIFDQDSRPSLRTLYDAVAPSITEGALVILDGLSELQSMGVGSGDVGRMVRALYAKTKASKAVLVSTLHADHLPLSSPSAFTSLDNDDLIERLLRIGDGGWWRVSHLPSGRSGDVMGEISSHPFGEGADFPEVPRSKPLQYRLETSTVRVFAKGTGRGFL